MLKPTISVWLNRLVKYIGFVLAMGWVVANLIGLWGEETKCFGWPREIGRVFSDSGVWWNYDCLFHAMTDVVVGASVIYTSIRITRRFRIPKNNTVAAPVRPWASLAFLAAVFVLVWLHSRPVIIRSSPYDGDADVFEYGWPYAALVMDDPAYSATRQPDTFQVGGALLDAVISVCFLIAATPAIHWLGRAMYRIPWRRGASSLGRLIIRLIPRFSLRTLVLAFLAFGSLPLLSMNWTPWRVAWSSAGHSSDPRDAEFFPDGSKILTLENGKVIAWDSAKGNKVFELPIDSYSIFHPEFSLSGSVIVTQDKSDDVVRVWSSRNGKLLKQFVATPKQSALFPLNNTILIFDPLNGNLTLKDFETGQVRLALKVHAFDVARTGASMAVIEANGRLGIWDVGNGQRRIQIGNDQHRMNTIRFTPDDNKVAAIEENNDISVWDVKTGNLLTIAHAQKAQSSWITSRECNGLGNTLIAAIKLSGTQSQIFDGRTGELLWSTLESNEAFHSVSFSPDEKRLVMTEYWSSIWSTTATTLRDSRSGTVLQSFDQVDDKKRCIASEFSPNEERILTTHEDGTLMMWARRRPEYWWGLAWLPEFWLTAVFAGALLWSVWRDRRAVRSQ